MLDVMKRVDDKDRLRKAGHTKNSQDRKGLLLTIMDGVKSMAPYVSTSVCPSILFCFLQIEKFHQRVHVADHDHNEQPASCHQSMPKSFCLLDGWRVLCSHPRCVLNEFVDFWDPSQIMDGKDQWKRVTDYRFIRQQLYYFTTPIALLSLALDTSFYILEHRKTILYNDEYA